MASVNTVRCLIIKRELVSALSGFIKSFKGLINIQGVFTKFLLSLAPHVTTYKPIQPNNHMTNLI